MRKKAEYLAFSVSYAVLFYEELYRRGLSERRYSYDEAHMISQAEFLALCTFLENTEHQGRIDANSMHAYETLLRIVGLGI